MREYRPMMLQKKPKQSKFFESFIQSKGPRGILMASSGEIQKAMKSFFLDLAYGNIVQDKYMIYLIPNSEEFDQRILPEAIIYAENIILEASINLQCYDFSRQNNLPITAQPAFEGVYNKWMMRAHTYSVILEGLRGYSITFDPSYLIAISTKLNSQMMRGSKQQLML